MAYDKNCPSCECGGDLCSEHGSGKLRDTESEAAPQESSENAGALSREDGHGGYFVPPLWMRRILPAARPRGFRRR